MRNPSDFAKPSIVERACLPGIERNFGNAHGTRPSSSDTEREKGQIYPISATRRAAAKRNNLAISRMNLLARTKPQHR